MPDFTLSCPDCGGAIVLSTDAIVGANPAQTTLDVGANAEIADVLELQDLESSSNKGKRYNQGYDQAFVVFWEVYPLKRDKRKAAKAWRNAVLRLGAIPGANVTASQAQILAGAIRYRDDPNRLDEFTKYAEGWLNGDGWEDAPLPQRLNGKAPAKPVAYHMPFCTECREPHPPGQHVEVSR